MMGGELVAIGGPLPETNILVGKGSSAQEGVLDYD